MAKGTTPEVGMGVTQCLPSMRIAYTITEVSKSGKQVTVQRDKVIRDGDAVTFAREPRGETVKLSLRSNGHWYRVHDKMDWWNVWAMDARDDYTDMSM